MNIVRNESKGEIPNPMENKPVESLNKAGKLCNMKPAQRIHSTEKSERGKLEH